MDEPAIACALSGADMKQRLESIAVLNRDALRAERRYGLTLELDYERSASERVRDFMTGERACCAFLEFEFEEVGDIVRLRITAPQRASMAADVIFERFAGRSEGQVRPCC